MANRIIVMALVFAGMIGGFAINPAHAQRYVVVNGVVLTPAQIQARLRFHTGRELLAPK